MCTRSYPECSVYGEGADGECDMDSSTENTNSSDSLDPTRQNRSVPAVVLIQFFSGPKQLNFLLCTFSHLTGSTAASVISGEEQFEDYGEGEDVDFTPSSPCPEEDTRTNGFSDLGSSLPSRLVAGRGRHELFCLQIFWLVTSGKEQNSAKVDFYLLLKMISRPQ